LFKKYTGKEINIIPIDGKAVDKSFIDTRKLIDYKIPSYEQMVLEMTNLIRSNKVLYSQYTV
jgi:dTDP-4-dehydrorhamnose reductase